MRAFFGFWEFWPVRRLLFLLCLGNGALLAQANFDLASFRTASNQERYHTVHGFPFSRLDSAAVASAYAQMYEVAQRQNDLHTRLALEYYKFRERKKLRLSYEQIAALLAGMEQDATAHHFAVERAVARHFAVFEDYDQHKISREQVYAAILLESNLNLIGGVTEGAIVQFFRDYDNELSAFAAQLPSQPVDRGRRPDALGAAVAHARPRCRPSSGAARRR